MEYLLEGRAALDSPVTKCMDTQIKHVAAGMILKNNCIEEDANYAFPTKFLLEVPNRP